MTEAPEAPLLQCADCDFQDDSLKLHREYVHPEAPVDVAEPEVAEPPAAPEPEAVVGTGPHAGHKTAPWGDTTTRVCLDCNKLIR